MANRRLKVVKPKAATEHSIELRPLICRRDDEAHVTITLTVMARGHTEAAEKLERALQRLLDEDASRG